MPAVFNNKEKKNNNKPTQIEGVKNVENFDAKQNLVGFFSLLLQIDKRQNPQNYQTQPVKK